MLKTNLFPYFWLKIYIDVFNIPIALFIVVFEIPIVNDSDNFRLPWNMPKCGVVDVKAEYKILF